MLGCFAWDSEVKARRARENDFIGGERDIEWDGCFEELSFGPKSQAYLLLPLCGVELRGILFA